MIWINFKSIFTIWLANLTYKSGWQSQPERKMLTQHVFMGLYIKLKMGPIKAQINGPHSTSWTVKSWGQKEAI